MCKCLLAEWTLWAGERVAGQLLVHSTEKTFSVLQGEHRGQALGMEE